MLTEKTDTEVIIQEDGQMWVKTTRRFLDDGVEVSHTIHRRPIIPGNDLTNESPEVAAHGKVAHTPLVVAKFHVRIAEANLKNAQALNPNIPKNAEALAAAEENLVASQAELAAVQ
jgi:exosome complex RNA-binding protein Rrp4